MAFVPGFEHDLFISYAHVDNQPRPGDSKGWVTQFGSDLAAALDQEIGRSGLVRVWRDRGLAGNDDFDDTIKLAVRQSALFMPVLSRGYINSAYCAAELATFAGQEHRLFQRQIDGKSRIFKIICRHVDPSEHPRATRDTLGYPFCKYDAETGESRVLYATRNGVPDEEYGSAIGRLAAQLARLLRTMSRMATVYVAEVEDQTLLPLRSRLLRFLRQSGFRVLPEDRLQPALPDFEATVEADLRKSALSIHIAGPRYGNRMANGRSRAHTVFDLAALRANSQRSPLVWLPPEAAGETDSDQRAFLDALYLEGPERFSAEQCLMTLEDLKLEILDKTFPHVVEPRPASARPAAEPLVYLSYLPVDEKQGASIRNYLRAEKCDLLASTAEMLDERERMNLKKCSGMVIVYGEAPPSWVRNIAVEARDVIATGGSERMRKFSIVQAPPEMKEDLGLSFSSLLLLDCTKGLDAGGLRTFVEAIRT
jgi:hypothetical protein